MQFDRRRLRIIAVGLTLLGILAMFQDKIGIKMDTTVVILFGLAILVYILPELSNLSKFKYGDLEFEFEKKVDQLEKLVIAEEAVGGVTINKSEQQRVGWQHYYSEYREILNSKSSNIEKILRGSQLVELMITEAGRDFGLAEDYKLKNPTVIMRELQKNNLISGEEFSLYNEFYSLRNKIIHGEIKEISDALTTRILDLLWRIVRIFG